MSKSSRNWLKEHHSDIFVQKSKKEGWRSRAVYKLMEIQEKDRIIKPNMKIVELGAAPGGWTQYLGSIIGDKGKIIALDLLPMDSLAGVDFIQGDFTETAVLEELLKHLDNKKADLLLSDMAPNMSGIKSADNAKSIYLCELVLDLAKRCLKKDGDLLVKIFNGIGFDDFYKNLKGEFAKVLVRKPQASRAKSQETYLLARGFLGNRDFLL